MSSDLQTIIALAIVGFCLAWFISRSLRKKHGSGCGSCNCGVKKPGK